MSAKRDRKPGDRPTHKRPTPEQLDERVKIPLPPDKAIEAILQVDPDSEPVEPKRGRTPKP